MKEIKEEYFRNLCLFSTFANTVKGIDEQHFPLHDWVTCNFPGMKCWIARDTEKQLPELCFPIQCLYQEWFLFVNPVGTNRSAFSFCCIWEVKEFEVQTAIFGSQSIRSHIFLKLDPIDPLSSPSKTWVEFWSQYITYGITDNTSLSWGPMSCQSS